MDTLFAQLRETLESPTASSFFRSILLFLVGAVSAHFVGQGLQRMLTPKAGAQLAAFARRLASYACFCLGAVMALRELGFDLTALLGAAGIVTVAFGFAAQTSTANLISGLFLMGERSFGIGDTIRVGQTIGEVMSIDMLSVKLRTMDNLFVRLPNEMMVKSEIVTLSHFAIRRIDMLLSAQFQQDIAELRAVLLRIADENPRCLDEPKPLFLITGQNEYALQLQFSVWTASPNYVEVRTELWMAVQQAFRNAHIEFPYPHRTVHLQPTSAPLA